MVRRAGQVAAMVAAVAIVLSACSWRLEEDPEPVRTPTPITVLRDHVAAAESALATAAGTSTDPLAAVEAAAVPIRLAALGGVSPTSSPRPDADFAMALSVATDTARDCMEAAGDDPLGDLCASILLSHLAMSAAAGTVTPEMTDYSSAVTGPGATTEVDAGTLARLALAHDQLRATHEVVAARSSDEAREDALALTASEGARVTALLAIDGVADLREPQYDVGTDSAAVLESQRAIADSYAALLVAATPVDREWLLNSALIAFNGAVLSGLTAEQIPALPGAVQPTPSPTAS
ncbi:hypothetical protein [Demequina sp.]|uniref:hypothetical protein n=1 Tax=Demequina sp. TaxID=2050685 RepID=UPI003D0F04ED